jgi:alpha/beta superfamily hydrolase
MPPALFIALPLTHFSFDFPVLHRQVGLIISGDQDDFCPPAEARIMAEQTASRLVSIPEADHFFIGAEKALADSVAAYAAEVKRHLFL